MAKDAPAAEGQPTAIAIVREDFTTEDGVAFKKGALITDPAEFRTLRKGPHEPFILPLTPHKS